MQSAWSTRFAVSAVLLTSTLAISHQSSVKLRRDGVLNLYPFPRVGRASRHTWDAPLNDMFLDYKPVQKRQLYAFPRVGRAGDDDVLYHRSPEKYLIPDNRYQIRDMEELLIPEYRSRGLSKREGESTDSTSMWFGPRLGRSQKNTETEAEMQSQTSEREQADPGLEQYGADRKKRQTN